MWWTTVYTLTFKLKQYRNVSIANFVYYGKTLLEAITNDYEENAQKKLVMSDWSVFAGNNLVFP